MAWSGTNAMQLCKIGLEAYLYGTEPGNESTTEQHWSCNVMSSALRIGVTNFHVP
jgi:hypothetical protein